MDVPARQARPGHRGYGEAAHHYQSSLDIRDRLGNQAGMTTSYSQPSLLEAEQPDGSAAAAIGLHVKALVIRLRLGSPGLPSICAASQRTAGTGPGNVHQLLSADTGESELTKTIMSLLDQLDAGNTEGA